VNIDNELLKIQENFHKLINERAEELVKENNVSLPNISDEIVDKEQWIPIPGMCGGFSYLLKKENGNFQMYVKSWCRVVGGSGQAHTIDKNGYTLTDEGFV